MIVWGFDERKWVPASPPLEASDSVTALDFSPRKSPQDKYGVVKSILPNKRLVPEM